MFRRYPLLLVIILLGLPVLTGGAIMYAAAGDAPKPSALSAGQRLRRLPPISEMFTSAAGNDEGEARAEPAPSAEASVKAEDKPMPGPLLPRLMAAHRSLREDDAATSQAQKETVLEEEVLEEDAQDPHASENAETMPYVEGPVEVEKPDTSAEEATDAPAETTEAEGNEDSTASEPSEAEPPPMPKRELSPDLAALRDHVRQTLASHQRQPFSTRQNTAGEIMDFCLAFGCETEITLAERRGGRRVNGITCLCWNYPCGGYQPLTLSEGRIAARVGYGTQMRPSQMLAMLAFSRVQPNYPLRVGNAVRTVADLIEVEKRDCHSGADLSLKLIALSHYLDQPTWENAVGQEWSLERIIQEELARPILTSPNGGLDRLTALGYALLQRKGRGLPVEGEFARAEIFTGQFYDYAFALQNQDGSWGYFLSNRGGNRNSAAALRSTAYVLEWLTVSFPEEQLKDPRIVAAVKYVTKGLSSRQYRSNVPQLSTLDINTYAHALHALAVYDDRYFKPADAEPPAELAPEESPAESATAARSARKTK